MTSYDLPVDVELIKRRNNFGYTEEEIKKYFSVPLHMPLDETGMDKSYIKAPPAPGIHPRVIFNPEDVPLIKDRLQNTKAGQSVKAAIWDHLQQMFAGPNAKFGKEYASLVAGDQKFIDQCTLPYNQLKTKYPNESFPTPDPKSDLKGEKPLPMDRSIGFIMMYEAFRCLIDNDQAGGKNRAWGAGDGNDSTRIRGAGADAAGLPLWAAEAGLCRGRGGWVHGHGRGERGGAGRAAGGSGSRLGAQHEDHPAGRPGVGRVLPAAAGEVVSQRRQRKGSGP